MSFKCRKLCLIVDETQTVVGSAWDEGSKKRLASLIKIQKMGWALSVVLDMPVCLSGSQG